MGVAPKKFQITAACFTFMHTVMVSHTLGNRNFMRMMCYSVSDTELGGFIADSEWCPRTAASLKATKVPGRNR